MRSLIIDPRMAGITGDMLLAALLDLTGDQNCLPLLTKAVCEVTHCTASVNAVRTDSMGINAVKMNLDLSGDKFATPEDLRGAFKNVANFMEISPQGVQKGLQVINYLSDVEKKIHETKFQQHEIASIDTVIETAGVVWILDNYGFLESKIYCLPVAVGNGTVSAGKMATPSPSPAVLEILCRKNIPVSQSTEEFELTSPTGIALAACLVDEFINVFPTSTPNRTGHGAGTEPLVNSPHIVRVIETLPSQETGAHAMQLETLVDDATGETLGYTINKLLEAGAYDAYITPATGKKNRPANLISVLCAPGEEQTLSCLLMKCTGSIGVRSRPVDRLIAKRKVEKYKVEIEGTKYPVRIKISTFDGHLISRKPEFDDLAVIAEQTGLSPRIVAEEVKRQCFLPIKDSHEIIN